MAESKSAALPLGYAPPQAPTTAYGIGRSGRRNIIAGRSAINDHERGFGRSANHIGRLPQPRMAKYNQVTAAAGLFASCCRSF